MFDGRAWLDAFEDSLRDELAGLAEVERTEWGPDLAVVDVEPFNLRSAPVTWIDMGRGPRGRRRRVDGWKRRLAVTALWRRRRTRQVQYVPYRNAWEAE